MFTKESRCSLKSCYIFCIMQKWLVVIVVFIAFAPLPAAQAADSAPTSVKVTQLPSVSVTRDCLDWLALFLTGTLVWIGWRGVSTANRTLKSIEKQVEEMKAQTAVAKTSADAALLNAKALIISERPWLVVSIEVHEFDPDTYIVRAVNKGNTPAELHEGHCTCGLRPVTGFTIPDNLQDPFIAPISNLIVNGEGFEIRRISISRFMTQDVINGVSAELLHVYGKLLYWDTFADRTNPEVAPYVTQWCFTYDSHRVLFFRTANGYSKNT